MNSNHIICGKFDNKVEIQLPPCLGLEKVKINSRRMYESPNTKTVQIAIGKENIWFKSRLWKIDDFFEMASKSKIRRLTVLTEKEKVRIIEEAALLNIKIDVFEKQFPIFKDIKYNSNPLINYNVLRKHTKKLVQLNIGPRNISIHLSNQHRLTALGKLRLKNNYDRNFFFAYKDAYQEVFKLKEERPDRVIIALDFNSMYVDCMKGFFCKPENIRYEKFQESKIQPEELPNGIYNVRLKSAKDTFLLDHHPFKYNKLGRSHYFKSKRSNNPI